MARVAVTQLIPPAWMAADAKAQVIRLLKALDLSTFERWILYRSWALETGATVSRDELEDR